MSSRKVNGQETVNMETVIDTGADVMIDLLIHRWGVRHVFECPGDRINGVIEAVRRQGDRCSARTGVIGRKFSRLVTPAISQWAMATRSRMRATRNRQKSSSASTRGNYQGINQSIWLAANPSYLLEANFPLKPDVTQKLPRRQQFVVPKEGPDA
jgi:hypothetical protein